MFLLAQRIPYPLHHHMDEITGMMESLVIYHLELHIDYYRVLLNNQLSVLD